MEQKKMILVEIDERGINTHIVGDVVSIMTMVTEVLSGRQKAIEKHANVSRDDSVELIDEVIKQYQMVTKYGKEAALARAIALYFNN